MEKEYGERRTAIEAKHACARTEARQASSGKSGDRRVARGVGEQSVEGTENLRVARMFVTSEMEKKARIQGCKAIAKIAPWPFTIPISTHAP